MASRKWLDVDLRRDDDASPLSSYRWLLRPTWMFMDRMIVRTNQCAQYNLKIVYKTWQKKHSVKHVIFLIKSNFLLFMIENLWRTFHSCIIYYCRTDIDEDEDKEISALQHKSKFNFKLFWKEIQIFVFPCCSTREDLPFMHQLLL